MGQIYGRHADVVVRGGIVVVLLVLVGGSAAWLVWNRHDGASGRGQYIAQPVPFSHAHHVGGLGIDCRYCHQTVETAAFAGLPPTDLCMNCHAQIWTEADLLAPVRESWRTGRRLQWSRVHDTAEFVYFDHSIHVAKGIGCVSCHGRVDTMPLMARAENLHMRDCLACHRDPTPEVVPRDKVFDVAWERPANQKAAGARLAAEHGIKTEGLTHCSACHR